MRYFSALLSFLLFAFSGSASASSAQTWIDSANGFHPASRHGTESTRVTGTVACTDLAGNHQVVASSSDHGGDIGAKGCPPGDAIPEMIDGKEPRWSALTIDQSHFSLIAHRSPAVATFLAYLVENDRSDTWQPFNANIIRAWLLGPVSPARAFATLADPDDPDLPDLDTLSEQDKQIRTSVNGVALTHANGDAEIRLSAGDTTPDGGNAPRTTEDAVVLTVRAGKTRNWAFSDDLSVSYTRYEVIDVRFESIAQSPGP